MSKHLRQLKTTLMHYHNNLLVFYAPSMANQGLHLLKAGICKHTACRQPCCNEFDNDRVHLPEGDGVCEIVAGMLKTITIGMA